jgi:hypothetical protein
MDNISRHLLDTAIALAKVEAATVTRTRYAVRLTSGAYAAPHWHWTLEAAQASRFESVTAANIYAVLDLGLELEEFSVEAV